MNHPEIAFILAGGKGLRMRRLGEYLPKCSLVIYDQPLLVRQIELCRKVGVSKVFVSISEKSKLIVQELVQKIKDIEVVLLVDSCQKGPVLALAEAKRFLESQGCIFFLGDMYIETDQFFHAILKTSTESLVLGTCLESNPELIKSGCNVIAEGEKVVKILEKPSHEIQTGNLVWAGIAYHPPSFFHFFQNP